MTATTSSKVPEYDYDDQVAMTAHLPASQARIACRVMDDLNSVNQAIVSKTSYVTDTLARIGRRVAGNDSMNSLGEIQGQAHEIDMLIGRREELRRTLASLTDSTTCPAPGDRPTT